MNVRAIGAAAAVLLVSFLGGAGTAYAGTAEKWGEVGAPNQGGVVRHVRTAGTCGTSNTLPVGLYANIGSAGLYKSSDDGATWTPIGFNRSPTFVNNFNIAQFGCSTGTPVREIYVATTDGVYKSQNDGGSWTKISTGLTCVNTAFVTYVSATNTYFAAAACTNAGLFKATRTTGFTESWSKVTALGDQQVNDFTFDSATGLSWKVATENGVFVSPDGGTTFTLKNGTGSNVLPPGGVNSLLWTATGAGSPLYAWANGYGVYKTTDDGANWTQANNGLPAASVAIGFTCYTPETPSNAGICTGTGHRVLLTVYGYGVYQTTDNAATWTPFALDAALPAARYVGPRDPRCSGSAASWCDVIYARTFAGVYKSTNRGTSWTKISNGLPAGYTTGVVWDRVNPDVAYGRFGWLYKTTDGGKTWSRIGGSTILGTISNMYVAPDNALYVATDYYGVYKSTDGGATFGEINGGLPANKTEFGATIAGDPVDANIIYLGTYTDGVYKSTNGGATWSASNGTLTGDGLKVRVLAVSNIEGSTDGAVYLNTMAGLYRSTDKGANWSFINPNGATSQARSVARNANPNVLFVALDKRLDDGTPDAMAGIWKSTDAGANWTQVLPGVIPRNMTMLASNSVYAYLLYGSRSLVRSLDLGATWVDVKGGFNDYWSRVLSVDRKDRIRFSASEAYGLIRHREGAFGVELNGDFQDDVLLRHTDGRNYAWLMNGIGTVDAGGFLPTLAGGSWTLAGTGDFNGDGYSDILWRASDGSNLVWLMKGRSVIWSGAIPSAGLNWTVAGIGDFDGDGRDDILWREVAGYNAMYLMTGFSQQTGLAVTQSPVAGVGIDWKIGAIVDLDRDGKADILWRNINGANFVFFMNGPAIKSQSGMAGVGADWQPATVADFNGDGYPDVLWRNIGGANYMWFLNGASVVGESAVPGIGNDWTAQAVGDFDGDGKQDVFWHNVAGYNWIWLMDGGAVKGTSGYTVVPGEPGWTIVNR